MCQYPPLELLSAGFAQFTSSVNSGTYLALVACPGDTYSMIGTSL